MQHMPEPALRRLFYSLVELTQAEQDLNYPEWVDPLNPHTQLWHGSYRNHPFTLQFTEPRGDRGCFLFISIPPFRRDMGDIAGLVWNDQISVDIYPIADETHKGVVVTRVVNRKSNSKAFHSYPEWVHNAKDVLDYAVDTLEGPSAVRRNPDEEMRRVQRLAATGDLQAIEKLKALRLRNGCDNERYAITYTSMGDVFRVLWPVAVSPYDKIIAFDLDCCESFELYNKLKDMGWETIVRLLKPFWEKDKYYSYVLREFSSDYLGRDKHYRTIQALNNTIDFLIEIGLGDEVDQSIWDNWDR